MRTETKGYFLKEYGSWSVLIIAFLVGIGVSRGFTWLVFPLFLALAMLVNSKQAFSKWLRKKGDQRYFVIFICQIVAATAVLVAVFGSDVPRLLPLLVIPTAYLLMNRFAGEHFLLTELLGFALLSLAAVLAKFLITNGIDVRLFVAVALYFTAGVFKVKVLLFKKSMDRVLAVLYVLFVVVVYRGFHLSLLPLLPLLENLIAAATLYKVRLQTTGWIEVAKSLAFLLLMLLYY